MYKIIDNALPRESFEKIKDTMFHSDFKWSYSPVINDYHKDLTLYFTHMFYVFEDLEHKMSPKFDMLKPILNLIQPKAVIRIKGNLYPSTPTLEVHQPHKDYKYKHQGAIFYMNTCNGYTLLEDDTKIDTVANRLLLFDSSTPHSSTSTTNQKARININFNFFK